MKNELRKTHFDLLVYAARSASPTWAFGPLEYSREVWQNTNTRVLLPNFRGAGCLTLGEQIHSLRHTPYEKFPDSIDLEDAWDRNANYDDYLSLRIDSTTKHPTRELGYIIKTSYPIVSIIQHHSGMLEVLIKQEDEREIGNGSAAKMQAELEAFTGTVVPHSGLGTLPNFQDIEELDSRSLIYLNPNPTNKPIMDLIEEKDRDLAQDIRKVLLF